MAGLKYIKDKFVKHIYKGQPFYDPPRSSNKYVEFKFKNDAYNKSFFPFVTKIYNSLDLSLRNLPNMADFKMNLKLKYKSGKIKHFSRGISKYANALHTQLQVGQ